MKKTFRPKEKSSELFRLLRFLSWMGGLLVSFAVGFALIDRIITVRWIDVLITQIAGWIIICVAFLSAILSIIKR